MHRHFIRLAVMVLLPMTGILLSPQAHASAEHGAEGGRYDSSISQFPSALRFGVANPGGPGSSELDSVAKLVGEPPSIVMWYADFRQPLPIDGLNTVTARGAIPLLTWEPWQAGAADHSPYALARIIAGDFDGYIGSWAKQLKKWNRPMLLRFAHEMDGDWYPWAEGVNGNHAGQYVAAWRHVHQIFTKAGASKVSWVWSPNVPYNGSTPLDALYPGAGYVDQVALDGYNWSTLLPWTHWTTPRALFGPGLAQLRRIA